MNTILSVEFTAANVKDAHTKATQIWRKFVDDPEAALPWDAAVKATAETIVTTAEEEAGAEVKDWHFSLTARVQQDEVA